MRLKDKDIESQKEHKYMNASDYLRYYSMYEYLFYGDKDSKSDEVDKKKSNTKKKKK